MNTITKLRPNTKVCHAIQSRLAVLRTSNLPPPSLSPWVFQIQRPMRRKSHHESMTGVEEQSKQPPDQVPRMTPTQPHIPRLVLKTPARSVDDDAHEAARKDASDGKGNDPSHVDPCHHAPVDGSPGPRAQTNANSRASDALGRRNGKLCFLVSEIILGHSQSSNLLRRVARMTVMAEPSSIEKPREGDCSVRRLPRFFIML